VRDVVAEAIVTNALIRTYYDEHVDQFAVPESAKVRHIVIAVTNSGPHPHTKEQALDIAKGVMAEIREKLSALRGSDPAAAMQAAAMADSAATDSVAIVLNPDSQERILLLGRYQANGIDGDWTAQSARGTATGSFSLRPHLTGRRDTPLLIKRREELSRMVFPSSVLPCVRSAR